MKSEPYWKNWSRFQCLKGPNGLVPKQSRAKADHNPSLCALSLLCTTTHSHKPEFFLFHILFWYVQHCTEHCTGVMQNFAELWHIFENAHEFCILNKKFLCLQVECCPKGPYIVYLKPFCCTIIPYTHTIFGAPKGHFLTIKEWSYDYETYANRFYG